MHREIASLLEHLVWPITISGWLYAFRSQFKMLLEEVGGVLSKANQLQLEFKGARLSAIEVQKEIKEAQKIAEQDSTSVTPIDIDINARLIKYGFQPVPDNLNFSLYDDLLDKDPTIVLMAIRRDLEIVTQNLGKAFGITKSNEPFHTYVDRLLRTGAIDHNQGMLIQRIYSVCSTAIHGLPITRVQAQEVLSIAQILKNQFINWLNLHFPD